MSCVCGKECHSASTNPWTQSTWVDGKVIAGT